MKEQEVAIVGAGIIGVCSALSLQMRGYKVTLIDPKGVAQECSKGNAGHFATEQVFPLADASLLPQVPKMLLDPLGPFRIRFSYLFKAIPWFSRFLLNMLPSRFKHNRDALKLLNEASLPAYQPLLKAANAESLLTCDGSLLTFENDNERAATALLRQFQQQGVEVDLLTREQIVELEPQLSERVKLALFFKTVGHTCDPELLCKNLADKVFTDGAGFVQQKVMSVSNTKTADGNKVCITTESEKLLFDKVVLATGAWSKQLLKPLGYKVPLDTERGYHLMLPQQQQLKRPVASVERKFIMTPMSTGLRLAGTVEFAGLEAKMDNRRADSLLPHAKAMLSGLQVENESSLSRWMGFRPSLPDSLPVIGQAPNHNNIYLAFGHQHLGLTQGAITGKLIAEIVSGETPSLDITPFCISRFN